MLIWDLQVQRLQFTVPYFVRSYEFCLQAGWLPWTLPQTVWTQAGRGKQKTLQSLVEGYLKLKRD